MDRSSRAVNTIDRRSRRNQYPREQLRAPQAMYIVKEKKSISAPAQGPDVNFIAKEAVKLLLSGLYVGWVQDLAHTHSMCIDCLCKIREDCVEHVHLIVHGV